MRTKVFANVSELVKKLQKPGDGVFLVAACFAGLGDLLLDAAVPDVVCDAKVVFFLTGFATTFGDGRSLVSVSLL
jgi:hypothetical protein